MVHYSVQWTAKPPPIVICPHKDFSIYRRPCLTHWSNSFWKTLPSSTLGDLWLLRYEFRVTRGGMTCPTKRQRIWKLAGSGEIHVSLYSLCWRFINWLVGHSCSLETLMIEMMKRLGIRVGWREGLGWGSSLKIGIRIRIRIRIRNKMKNRTKMRMRRGLNSL